MLVQPMADWKGIAAHLLSGEFQFFFRVNSRASRRSTYSIDERQVPTSPFATSTVPSMPPSLSILRKIPIARPRMSIPGNIALLTVCEAASRDAGTSFQEIEFSLEATGTVYSKRVPRFRAEAASSSLTQDRSPRDRDPIRTLLHVFSDQHEGSSLKHDGSSCVSGGWRD